ncbi:hypothetical protein JG688_00008520 [Phytophthora aleatoria]|uniref:Uncharacterized protein n=1 Tax=Phytophthora aleatoria TaxID=2496075 RepID=A0A8J5IYB0_9STRA|nr:hypothetical protein JG688_00008520 [Phytophthora aleatoria]
MPTRNSREGCDGDRSKLRVFLGSCSRRVSAVSGSFGHSMERWCSTKPLGRANRRGSLCVFVVVG